MKVQARLVGLAMIGLGCGGMGLVYLLWRLEPIQVPRPPLPPGMRPDLVPVISPFTCILPLMAIASSLLVLDGLRRLVLPD